MAEIKKQPLKKPRRERIKLASNRIWDVMQQKDMCAQELADLTGTSPPHICRIVKNRKLCISLPIALMIGRALDTPVEELFLLPEKKKS